MARAESGRPCVSGRALAAPGVELPESLTVWTGFLLHKAAQRVHDRVEERLEPLGLRPRHVGVMRVLAAEGPHSQHALCERLRIDRTTMVSVVDDLERLGLAERQDDPADRRAYRVQLTRYGEERLAEACAVVNEAEEQLLAPLSPEERVALRTLLCRICGLHR